MIFSSQKLGYIYSAGPVSRRVFVELPQEDYQAGDEHMCGLLQYSLYGPRGAAQHCEGRACIDTSDLTLMRGIACPCVWQGCIKGEHNVTIVYGDRITSGGERAAVGFLIKMISRKCEIKKQAIGEDADPQKMGRILNRVIDWGCDGITIEADQRHVREILEDLELERANHSATPCAVEWKNEGQHTE